MHLWAARRVRFTREGIARRTGVFVSVIDAIDYIDGIDQSITIPVAIITGTGQNFGARINIFIDIINQVDHIHGVDDPVGIEIS